MIKSNMKWMMVLSPSASCECGATDQTARHIASECPLNSGDGDLAVLDPAARNWLHDLQYAVYNSSIKPKKKKKKNLNNGQHSTLFVLVFVYLSVPSGDPLYHSDNCHACCCNLLF